MTETQSDPVRENHVTHTFHWPGCRRFPHQGRDHQGPGRAVMTGLMPCGCRACWREAKRLTRGSRFRPIVGRDKERGTAVLMLFEKLNYCMVRTASVLGWLAGWIALLWFVFLFIRWSEETAWVFLVLLFGGSVVAPVIGFFRPFRPEVPENRQLAERIFWHECESAPFERGLRGSRR